MIPSLALSIVAATPTGEPPACVATPPPSTISEAAQAYLRSTDDRRFLAEPPSELSEWSDLQHSYRSGGESWVKTKVATGQVVVEWSRLAGIRIARTRPTISGSEEGPLVLNFHGGGYALNDGDAALYSAVSFAIEQGLESVTVDYRLIPQHPYPAALDDAVAVYRAMVFEDPARPIVVYGLSAGGGLGAAFLLKLRELGLPMPKAAVLNSPWVDVAMEGDSYRLLDCADPLLGRSTASLQAMAAMYVGNADQKDPLVSPIYGDWSGMGVPILLLSGTRDLLLSDTVRLHQAMRDAGADSELLIYDGMWHAFSVEPELARMLQHSADFMRTRSKSGERP